MDIFLDVLLFLSLIAGATVIIFSIFGTVELIVGFRDSKESILEEKYYKLTFKKFLEIYKQNPKKIRSWDFRDYPEIDRVPVLFTFIDYLKFKWWNFKKNRAEEKQEQLENEQQYKENEIEFTECLQIDEDILKEENFLEMEVIVNNVISENFPSIYLLLDQMEDENKFNTLIESLLDDKNLNKTFILFMNIRNKKYLKDKSFHHSVGWNIEQENRKIIEKMIKRSFVWEKME
jgi:hypothetical protein